MKTLLIHFDNTFLKDEAIFEEAIKFPNIEGSAVDSNFDIDLFLNSFVRRIFLNEKTEAECVFIHYSLSQNYLELLGIRLAYHIRLTKELDRIANVPIVFIGEESIFQINKLSDLGEILFTEGIYTSKQNVHEVKAIIGKLEKGKLRELTNRTNFIEKIHIAPPANYASHHSVANEWSILKYAKIFGIQNLKEEFQEINENILGLLYYKYLLEKFPPPDIDQLISYNIDKKGSILFIDDEAEKGWDKVLNAFFANSPKIEFNSLKFDFKNKSKEDIIRKVVDTINNELPDLVILDLRLHDSDFSSSREKLTGIKIIPEIKNINRGIQIIIFTASNKVWNLQYAIDKGADSYIIKESPEYNSDSSFTKENIENFKKKIKTSLQNSFLKKFDSDQKEINEYLDARKKERVIDRNFVNPVKIWLDLTFENLRRGIDEKSVSSSFIFYFNLIELSANQIINIDQPIFENGRYKFQFRKDYSFLKTFRENKAGEYVKHGNEDLTSKNQNIPWAQKLYNTASFCLEVDEFNNFSKLFIKRNNLIHGNLISLKYNKIEIDDVISVYQLLKSILLNIGIKNTIGYLDT